MDSQSTKKVIDTLVTGTDTSLSDSVKQRLETSIRDMGVKLDSARANRTTKQVLGTSGQPIKKLPSSDSEIYTTISDMLNGDHSDFAGIGTLLDNLYAKNKRYFSIIKDYEIMPILIPQINRVLMFLVNECLSPDIQNKSTFQIKFTGATDEQRVQADIDAIKKEMKLDNLLREVYMNRYKLGFEYYAVIDYDSTFRHMTTMLQKKRLNEDTAGMSDIDFIEEQCKGLSSSINECTVKLRIQALVPQNQSASATGTRDDKELVIGETVTTLNFEDMNIKIDRSPAVKLLEEAQAELISEAYSGYKSSRIFDMLSGGQSLNEAVTDTSKLEQLVDTLKKKKLQRCTIERFDPAKKFRLKLGGKIIGYFYVTDINGNASSTTVNFAQALRDQLLKSRANNLSAATQSAEEVISKELAEKIINTFDPNIGISRIEDIDLLHNYIQSNEIYRGNKRITFYYADEIYDLSRSDGSILTNAVFFTKLYSTLMLNNVETKVLRGRGRQIHTVRMGVSPSVQRYIQNAMAALTMPENNLGALHGPFEQIMNPFNSASDIIIPTEEGGEKYIETDYIPGQDVNMDDEFLRMLLNAIVSSFGLDSAVIDATNGNLQFARTLTMESLQIANAIRNEQQDVHDSWEALCLEVLRIMGSDATKTAVDQGQVIVQFYEPKSLIMQTTIDDINNAKTHAEAIADIIPEFNEEGTELKRSKFVYEQVKKNTNYDWGSVEEAIANIHITAIDDALLAEIRKIIQEYQDNTRVEQFGDENNDGVVNGEDGELGNEYGGYEPDENPDLGDDTGEDEGAPGADEGEEGEDDEDFNI